MKAIVALLIGGLLCGISPLRSQTQTGRPRPQAKAHVPRIELELGYLRTWHPDDAITRSEWIEVPGTWRDPANFPGQSQYAFTFRDPFSAFPPRPYFWQSRHSPPPPDWTRP